MNKILFSLFYVFFISLVCIGCKTQVSEPEKPGPVWVTFSTSNGSGLINDNVHAIMVDGENRVWIATNNGASSFQSGYWSAIIDSLSYQLCGSGGCWVSRKVNSIAEGKDGSIWFGLDGGGIKRYNRFSNHNLWQTFSYPDIFSGFVLSVAAYKYGQGDVWVGTSQGISRFIPGTVDPTLGTWYIGYNDRLPAPNVHSVAFDPLNGWVFFGTTDGLAAYDSEFGGWSLYADSARSTILSISFDLSNNVWLGRGKGVTRINLVTSERNEFTSINTNGKLPAGIVNAVTTDMADTRWFGTANGLVRFKDTTWTTFTHATKPELPDDIITALCYDKKGNLWIGTPKGIAVYNENGTRF